MDRQEALRIYETGRETVIETLLSFVAYIHELEQAIATLIKKLRANENKVANPATRAKNGNLSHPKWWLKPTTSFPSNALAAISLLPTSYRFLHQILSAIRSLIYPQ